MVHSPTPPSAEAATTSGTALAPPLLHRYVHQGQAAHLGDAEIRLIFFPSPRLPPPPPPPAFPVCLTRACTTFSTPLYNLCLTRVLFKSSEHIWSFVHKPRYVDINKTDGSGRTALQVAEQFTAANWQPCCGEPGLEIDSSS